MQGIQIGYTSPEDRIRQQCETGHLEILAEADLPYSYLNTLSTGVSSGKVIPKVLDVKSLTSQGYVLGP